MSAGRFGRIRAVRIVRTFCAAVTLASATGLLMLGAGIPTAAADSGSSITVSWLNDSSSAAQYQPTRPTRDSSGALGDFKNLSITVGQSTDLVDQTLRVSYQGMAATVGNPGAGRSNYLQVMQCWGADPNAVNFRNTCAFGAWAPSGINNAPANQLGGAGAGRDITARPSDVPFTAPDGTSSTPDRGNADNGIRQYFNSTTGNEQDFVTIPDDGGANAGFTLFNAQSAATAPWLGCGTTTADHGAGNRCWLVVIPRGTHSGSISGDSTSCESSAFGDGGFGTVTGSQIGSPLSTDCGYWNDRVVVPLTFTPVATHCADGSQEVNTNGSMLLDGAMHSWQQALCSTGASTYNIANNSGALTRSQLLSGQVGLAFLGEPVTQADDDSGSWSTADIRYGPVANAALTIGFVAESALGQQVTTLKLTPRLLAKLLTQSYQFQVPTNAHTGQFQVPELGDNPTDIGDDPEFQQLNPGVHPLGLFVSADVGFIEVGPQGDDALQLLWQWIESDKSAATWLSGTPDENGMVVNPYYLPSSNPKALGGGLGAIDLSKGPVDRIYRADPTSLVPDASQAQITLDSVSLSPFAKDFPTAALRIAQGDTQTGQDSLVPAAASPTLQADSPRVVGAQNKDVMGITDAASAALNGLGMAELQLPNQPGVFVAPTQASIAAAAKAEVPVGSAKPAGTITAVDYSGFPAGAYPLTTTIYAAVNITNPSLDQDTRNQYATLIDYAIGTGQTPGTELGELPEGYAPLGTAQVAQAHQLADILTGKLDPNLGSSDQDSGSGSSDGYTPPTVNVPGGTDGPDTVVDTASSGTSNTAAVSASPKQAASTTAVGGAALGGSLLAGVAGALVAPLLMRRKVVAP
jgi:hypothetical protein